jgi:retron-type reverse transcriptase
MKTFNNIFTDIITWHNLLKAAHNAGKGKRYQPDVARFHYHLESSLLQLQHELATRIYRPGPYRSFMITDPKERMISAAPFRDRVVHHALCNVIAPIFERTFIYDSYANRIGKGTHKAIERCQYYSRRYPYVLKCDIRKCFPSIDHLILKQEIRWKITCPDTLWLCDLILDNSNLQEEHTVYFPGDDLFTPHERRRGLPIGNLTSQFWANVYLNRFDHFVKEYLGVPGYVRYVDDFILFSDKKEALHGWKADMEAFLGDLRLILHPTKTQVHRVTAGVPFLGFRVFPFYRYVNKARAHRAERHLCKKASALRFGSVTPESAESTLNSWLGHIRFGQSRRMEGRVFRRLCEEGVEVCRHPSGSWRVLEYVS